MPRDYSLNVDGGKLGIQVTDRRSVLIGIVALVFSRSIALAQNSAPKLFVLPKGFVSHIQFKERSPKDPRKILTLTNISLEGYLVCNGAAASRTDYPELFKIVRTQYGPGDGTSTFNLPAYPVKYGAGEPVSGMAMCPSSKLGLPVSVVLPFDVHDSSPSAPPHRPQ